jgi:hypothetical protein
MHNTEMSFAGKIANNSHEKLNLKLKQPSSWYKVTFLSPLRVTDGVRYDSYVREREAARRDYSEAVRQGKTAGHVALR